MTKKLFFSLAVAVLSIICIFIFSAKWNAAGQVIIVKLKYLIGLALIYCCQWFIGAWRMLVVADGLHKKLSFLRALKISFLGDFFAQITPSSMGGQPAKVIMLSNGEEKYGKNSAIVAVESASEICFFLFMLPLAFMRNRAILNLLKGYSWVTIPVSFLLTCGLVYVIIFKSHVVAKLIDRFLQLPIINKIVKEKRRNKIIQILNNEIEDFADSLLYYYKYSKIHLILTILLSVIYWSLRFALLYFVIRGFGVQISFWFVYYLQIMLFFFTTFVPSPGGGAEFILIFLLKGALSPAIIASVILNWRFFTYFLTIIIGSLLVFKSTLFKTRQTAS